jgi:hypothetical protein
MSPTRDSVVVVAAVVLCTTVTTVRVVRTARNRSLDTKIDLGNAQKLMFP